ncbi:hypothetical protein [Saccharopolyspora elongata]|nr:hypothetical protein [Saccharopolyspora elongata]
MARRAGASETTATDLDHIIRTGLSTATPGTVQDASTSLPVLLLTSDGIHDALSADQIADIVDNGQLGAISPADPQTIVDALVDEAVQTARRRRTVAADNATAVLMIPTLL